MRDLNWIIQSNEKAAKKEVEKKEKEERHFIFEELGKKKFCFACGIDHDPIWHTFQNEKNLEAKKEI